MQPKSIYHVIGLMSGSSLDGLDIAFCRFEQQHEEWIFKILAAQTFQYSKLLQKKLATLHQVSAKELMITDVQLARLWEAYIEDFILKNEIEKVDFIASHGHTIFHEPKLGFSTQIGNGATIAAMTGIPTVCDFRSTDIALGGQGAPLVPMGDLHLFKEYTACLNLGGICNISLKKENLIFAYDIAPCNQLLNFFAKEIGKDFDENGNLAKSGKVNLAVLRQLNDLDFYHSEAPKSLSNQYSNILLEILNQEKSVENKLRTTVEHLAFQISLALNSSNISSNKKCLVTGGGTFNSFLIKTLQSKTDWQIIIPDKNLINFKEALIFGFLGVLRWRNEVNISGEITGAIQNNCSGSIYL